jgi:plastocyanin
MRRIVVGLGAVAATVLLAGSGSAADPPSVNIQFSAFGPSQVDALPGETVSWANVSQRTHTVTSDTGLFESGDLPPGAKFAQRFEQSGVYRFHCSIHASMVGEVDVRRVILGPLPTAAVPVGSSVEFSGRTADVNRTVAVQRSTDGSAFTTIATAAPAADGSWSVQVSAQETGDYRALSGSDASQTRRLLVSSRRIRVRRSRAGIAVTVTPSAPYAPILVEKYERERFGWWPVSKTRLDYVSEADIRVRRPARVRVVLVDKDGWTPLVTSPVVVLR